MKEFTFSYDTKDKGISGSFTRSLPEVRDISERVDLAVQNALNTWRKEHPGEEPSPEVEREVILSAADTALTSLYWGWFRQVQVTLRAEAKRLREGNKSNAPLSEKEVAERMSTGKLPVYAEPSEVQDKVAKIADSIAGLSPADIARLREKLGITEHNGR